MNQPEWNIKEREDSCTRCKKAFADGEEFFSRLEFGEEGYFREDLCGGCWSDDVRDRSLSYWKSVFKVPPPPAPEPLQKETAESLLRKLMEEEDYSKLNTIYILAVMLERKRILAEKEVQHQDEGFKVRVYEHKKTGETFLIKDPGLKLSQLEDVQEEVVTMLGGKKPGSSDEEPEAASQEGPGEGARPTGEEAS